MAKPTTTRHLSHPSKGPAAPESWPPVRDPGGCRQASQSGWAVSQVLKSPTPQCVPLLSKKQRGGACTAARTAPGAASPPTAYTRPTQLSSASCSESNCRPPPVSNAVVLVPLLSLWAPPSSPSASVHTSIPPGTLCRWKTTTARSTRSSLPLVAPSAPALPALSVPLLPRALCTFRLSVSELLWLSPGWLSC